MSYGKHHNLYVFNKEGGFEKHHFSVENLSDNYWLNLCHPGKPARQALKPLLPKVIYQALFAKEDRPRNIITPEGIFLSLRGVNMTPGEAPDDMVFLRLWLTDKGLITVEHAPVQAVRDMHNILHVEPNAQYDAEGCFVTLIEQLLSHIEEENYELDGRLDDIEEIMGKHDIDTAREKLVEIRQRIINFRRYLLPQREALYKLAYEKPELIDGKYNGALKDANQEMLRHLETIDAGRDRATVLQDNLTNMFSERLNEKIYVLSIVALIFMPTMLITSLLGINVHIPGSDHKSAFWFVCILLATIVTSLYLFLKRKRWI